MIAARAAWPRYDTDTGFRGGGSIMGHAFFALKARPEMWHRLGAVRQAEILDALVSAAARLSGIQRPDDGSVDVAMTVGIAHADPERARGRIYLNIAADPYLAQRTVAVRPWRLDSIDA